MSNYIISFDLSDADDGVRTKFKNEMLVLGWIIWERRTIDQEICKLPNTTMIIKNKNDDYVVSTVETASNKAELKKNGAKVSKFIISEYRRVHFHSDEPLTNHSRAADLLKDIIEQDFSS